MLNWGCKVNPDSQDIIKIDSESLNRADSGSEADPGHGRPCITEIGCFNH